MTSPTENPVPREPSPAQRALLDERLRVARKIVARWAQNGGRRPPRLATDGLPRITHAQRGLGPRPSAGRPVKADDPAATKRALLVQVLQRSLNGSLAVPRPVDSSGSGAAAPAMSGKRPAATPVLAS